MWIWAAIAAVPLGGLLAHEFFKPRPFYTGTNSVEVRSIVATLAQGQTLCMPDTDIPAGTGVVELAAIAPAGVRPALALTIAAGGRTVAAGTSAQHAQAGLSAELVALASVLPGKPAFRNGTVCVRSVRGPPVQFGGMVGVAPYRPSPTLDGAPINNAVSLWFLPPHGEQRSLASQWPQIMRRIALFRPGFAGPLFYWLLFLLFLPLTGYFAIRLLAVAEEPRRRIVLPLALIAFVSFVAWSATIAAFDSPDESEHFAYVETLAETGHAPDPAPSARPPYATDEAIALAAIRHFSQIESVEGRPPWDKADQTSYRTIVRSVKPHANDGGGFNGGVAPHSPIYYGIVAVGYEAGKSGGIFTELFWTRLMSALLALVVPLAAFGTMRELVPSRRDLAVAAGLLVCFEPMFSYISGAVNNDVGANAAAALLAYLVIRALRRGLSWRLALGIGLTAAVAPLMKGTAYAVLPAVGVALATIALRARTLKLWRNLAIAVASFGALTLIWKSAAASFHRSTFTVPGGAANGTGLMSQLGGRLVYLWEVFFPRLPGMSAHWLPGQWPFYDIYVTRSFAAFGWYSIFFPDWVYRVILGVVLLAGIGAIALLVTRFDAVRARWREALFLMLTIAGVFGGVEFEYYSPWPRPVFPEQGRYAFPAMVPLACLALSGLLVLRRRRGTAIATVALVAMIVLSAAARMLYLTGTYT